MITAEKVTSKQTVWFLLLGACAFVLVICSLFVSARVFAIWGEVHDTDLPGHLTLRSQPAKPQWKDIVPGETVNWQIEANLDDSPEASLTLKLIAMGELIDHNALSARITSCEIEGCADPQIIREFSKLQAHDSEIFELATLQMQSPRYVNVELSMLEDKETFYATGASAKIGLGFHATGDLPPKKVSPPTLTTTGFDSVALLVTAASFAGIGVAIIGLRRSKQSGVD